MTFCKRVCSIRGLFAKVVMVQNVPLHIGFPDFANGKEDVLAIKKEDENRKMLSENIATIDYFLYISSALTSFALIRKLSTDYNKSSKLHCFFISRIDSNFLVSECICIKNL